MNLLYAIVHSISYAVDIYRGKVNAVPVVETVPAPAEPLAPGSLSHMLTFTVFEEV